MVARVGAIEFGNDICSVTFPRESVRAAWGMGAAPYGVRYTFFLSDGEVGAPVDHVDEYLVPWMLLERLARAAGMRPIARDNFHDWFARARSATGGLGEEADKLLKKMNVLDCEGTVPSADWEVAGLYRVFAFEVDPDAASAGADVRDELLREALLARQAPAPAVPAMQYRAHVRQADIADL